MAEGNGQDGTSNGAGAAAAEPAAQAQINVLGHYIKDFSFENPNAPRVLQSPPKNPNIQIGFNVGRKSLAEDMYEVALTLEAEAKSDDGLLYKLEMVYAGGFRLKGLPEQAINPVLMIECPALLFPFVRRLAADITREGGFPPLLIDPIDFASLYRQKMADQPARQEAG